MEEVLGYRLNGLTVVCENFGDPHNVGAVVRTCEALGILNVYIVEEHLPCKLSKQVTAGADAWLDIHRYRRVKAALSDLREWGYRIYSATPEGSATDLEQVPCDAQLALVFGNEQEGITPEALGYSDGAFTIPMYGFVRSLNVSAAAAIAVHSCSRRWRSIRGSGDLSPSQRESWQTRYLERKQERSDSL
ncbi:MAG: RNA methyltransferase [Candidatus Bipolaricaulota bacterium]